MEDIKFSESTDGELKFPTEFAKRVTEMHGGLEDMTENDLD